MTDRRFEVTALGEPLVEFNQTQRGEPTYLRGYGGDTSNAIIAAARSGARTAYLTRLGSDEFGDDFAALWAAEGVDTSGISRDPEAPTGLYFVSHTQAGHQFTYRRQGSAASLMTPGWLPREVIAQSNILHVSGISMAISMSAFDTVWAALQAARDAGTQVSLDANVRLRLWPIDRARECLMRALPCSDVFLPSEEDMQLLTGLDRPEAMIDWAHAQGVRTVVLKRGSQGCWVSDGMRRQALPPYRVRVVDATGAGDCFSGNLLARLSAGDDVFAAAQYANAAAALSVQGFGAVAPLPRPEAVRALMG
jgi:2-dehydro-3-deoxygluconokinase